MGTFKLHFKLPRRGGQSGLSLLELLMAICVTVIVVTTLSVSFSIGSKHMLLNRQRWLATRLANTQIQALKSQPYAYLDTTDTTFPPASYPLIFTASNTTCDCNQVDFSTLPSTSTQASGVTFNMATCINFVNLGTWIPQCASAGDTGNKQLLVHVWWTLGQSSATVTQEALSIRS